MTDLCSPWIFWGEGFLGGCCPMDGGSVCAKAFGKGLPCSVGRVGIASMQGLQRTWVGNGTPQGWCLCCPHGGHSPGGLPTTPLCGSNRSMG